MALMFRVQKITPDGSVKIEYSGTLREKTDEYISIDTGWSREPLDLGYVIFEPDDVWIETFYFRENFNIFLIADRNGKLKGFYCNVTYPPEMGEGIINWRDLAVDIWVRPDGSYLILDEDEFEEMGPSEKERKIVKGALEKILSMLSHKKGPFSELEHEL